MDQNYYITDEEIEELKRVAREMPMGIKVGRIVRNVKYNANDIKIDASFRSDEELPGLDELLINVGAKFRLVKDFVKASWERWKELAKPEDDLDYYVDDKGREYYIEDGARIYIDPRGFEYFRGYDPETKETVYQFMYDGKIATFINDERSLFMINGMVYSIDDEGMVYAHRNVDYIDFKRR